MRERLGAGIFEGGRDGIGLLRQKGFHPFLCMSGGRRQKAEENKGIVHNLYINRLTYSEKTAIMEKKNKKGAGRYGK